MNRSGQSPAPLDGVRVGRRRLGEGRAGFNAPTLRRTTALALVVFAVALTGCRTVHVYERGHLAHPTMRPDTVQSPSEEHMRSIHEGSTGGSGAAGGGCGCN